MANLGKTPSTLRMRIFLIFGVLFVAVLAADQIIERFGLPFLSFEGRNKEKQKEAFRALNLTADLKKERLQLWLEERRADLNVAAESPVIQSSLGRVERELHRSSEGEARGERFQDLIGEGEGYRQIRQHIEVMKSSYGAYERIDFLDLHSGVVLISTDERKQGSNIFEDVASLSGLSSLEGDFINIWRHPESGVLDMHTARAVRLPGKGGSGLVLLMHINITHFLEPFLHTGGGLGQTGEALLINEMGVILSPLKFPLPDGSTARPLQYRITAQPATLATGKEEGIVTARDYRGVPVLAAYRYIELSPKTGWGLVVKRDEAEIFQAYRSEDLLSLILFAFGILFVVAFTYVLAGGLSRPLSHLSDTARQIREGDLNARAPVEGTEEVKVLAEAFNAMVDQLKRNADQLMEKNEELEAFVYTAAHDLKNPLIGVQGYLKVFEKSLPEGLSENRRDLLNKASLTLERFERILTDLLEYSQVRSAPVVAGHVDAEILVERIRAEQWEKIKKTGARIHVGENLPEIHINDSRAYQIFSNLISNSLKFVRDGVTPVIEIGWIAHPRESIPETHSLFFIMDNGIGIEELWHERIFSLFERVDETREDGSGTGLAIVRRIIRQVNGKIWVRSTPGSGTTFYFTLPTAPWS